MLIPHILFPDYWLICHTCVISSPSSFAPFIISLCLPSCASFIVECCLCLASCPALHCPALPCPVLSCPVLSCQSVFPFSSCKGVLAHILPPTLTTYIHIYIYIFTVLYEHSYKLYIYIYIYILVVGRYRR